MDLKFWMVFAPNGNAPKHQHATMGLAEKEAKRLAYNNPLKKFYVLQSVKEIEFIPECRVEDIPF